jgi:NAD(P)-dependent dehydrogenase (short-subunit alcohol dehydrogenase family)
MEVLGKVAVITGAGGEGQGRAVARRLAREGASVVVSDVNEGGGRETVRLIGEEGGRAEFFQADAGVERDVGTLIASSEEKYGGVDILVNNAGPYFHAVPLEKWFEAIQANLMGTAYATLSGIEAIRKRGGGAIVNFLDFRNRSRFQALKFTRI